MSATVMSHVSDWLSSLASAAARFATVCMSSAANTSCASTHQPSSLIRGMRNPDHSPRAHRVAIEAEHLPCFRVRVDMPLDIAEVGRHDRHVLG
eukprot:scaffold57640_cov74-Phaeocystis_antarctica.AAC.4